MVLSNQISIIFFSDPAVQALQFLDVISMKDPSQKAQFFRTTLTDIFPYIPRVRIFSQFNYFEQTLKSVLPPITAEIDQW